MRKLTDEELNKEIGQFYGNVELAGLQNYLAKNDQLTFSLSNGVCGLNNDTGCAYPGSLLVHINYVCALATRIANTISATFKTDLSSLVKCCILQHIAKLVMYEPNDNEWEVEKRGQINKFVPLNARLKCGLRGALMALNHGVQLTPIEMESITCLDRDDDNGKAFDNIMTTIIRQANELAYAIEKEKYGNI